MLNATRECQLLLTLKYHAARPPSDWTVQKLERALGSARKVVADAIDQMNQVIAFHPSRGFDLLAAALRFHFELDVRITGQQRFKLQVRDALVAIGMGLNGRIVIADTLGPTYPDLHREYQEAPGKSKTGHVIPKVLPPIQVAGPSRIGDGAPDALGYVSPKTPKGQPRLDPTRDRPPEDDKSGRIHLHFAVVESQSTAANVALLVHEASHKFARTIDASYAEGAAARFHYYENFPVDQRIINADCYGYLAVSLFLRQLIKGRSDLYRLTNAEGPPAGAPARQGGAPPSSARGDCAVM